MDYQNTKIYKIISHQGDKVYIGSTTKKNISDEDGASSKRLLSLEESHSKETKQNNII